MKSPSNLDGKIAFITGSTRGIGWATAKILAKNGATIIINGISNQELLNQRVETLKEYNADSSGLLFDVSDANQVREHYKIIYSKFKRLDILVNNAGIMKSSLIGMTTPALIDEITKINIHSICYNIQFASRLMSRGNSGSIINMSSIVGICGAEGQMAYSGSKAAVIGITKAASKELASQGIRVNAIAPGVIETDLIKDFSEEKLSSLRKNISMKRLGNAEDVANVALFLASELSQYVTGQVIGVDGGLSL